MGDKNVLWFSDNRLLPLLFGEHDKFIARIEESLKLRISSRGTEFQVLVKNLRLHWQPQHFAPCIID